MLFCTSSWKSPPGVITAPRALALVVLQGRCLFSPWLRADVLRVAHPRLGVVHPKPHPTCYPPSTLSIPLALEKDSNSLAKPTSVWDLLPDGCCVVLGTAKQPVGYCKATCKASFCCVLNHADAGSWTREGERMLGRKAAPNPPL